MRSKQITEEEKEFTREGTKKKKLTPRELKEKLEDRFDKQYDYMTIANLQRNVNTEFFGEATADAALLQKRIMKLKQKYPNMLAKIKKNNKNELEGLIYSMPVMKEFAEYFFDLVVLDTTFSTNRFRLKHLSLCGKDNHNKTILFVEGLVSKETTEEFTWFFEQVKEYFGKEPKILLMDADPALLSACEHVFTSSTLKICGWHTEANIKKHLMGLKKSKLFISKIIFRLIGLESIKDESSQKDLYNLAINLPHEGNKGNFERHYSLLLNNLQNNTKNYFEKLYSKKEQWCKAFKKDDSLETYSTGIVENVNKLLKEHVNSQCSLNEYLFRMLKFTNNLNNNNGISAEEALQHNSYYSHLASSVFILSIKNHVTEFALMRTVICMMKSFAWIRTKKI